MIVVLFDLEGTLVQSIEADEKSVQEFRTKTREKLVELGVPHSELEGIEKSTLMYNKAFEHVEEQFSPRDARQFHFELDRFLKTYQMR